MLVPQRGPRRALVELASKNAAASFVSRRDRGKDTETTLARLQRRLGLPKSAARDRVLRHLARAGHRPGGLDGGVRGRRAGEGALPYLSHQARHGRRRLRLDVRGAVAPVPPSARGDDRRTSPWRLPDLLVVDGGKGQLWRGAGGGARHRHRRAPGRGPAHRRAGQGTRLASRCERRGVGTIGAGW